MHSRARRLAFHPWAASARRALLALCLLQAVPATAETIVGARYAGPTLDYPHAVLGDAQEWRSLDITVALAGQGGTTPKLQTRRITLPDDHVFEDLAPRLVDVTGDGAPEIIVIETDMARGAALALYGSSGKIAETQHIGTRYRWLAPLGAADLDGDGRIEIAYVDRPHLAKTLRLWRFDGTSLKPVADLKGVTNHRIGDAFIVGGIRACSGLPEMVLASADWSEMVSVRFGQGRFTTKTIGANTSRDAFERAMICVQ